MNNDNAMDVDHVPPDPGNEAAQSAIRKAVNWAADTPEYYSNLWKAKQIIEEMSTREVSDILRRCGAESREFRSDEEAREQLVAFLQSKKQPRKSTLKNAEERETPGHKRYDSKLASPRSSQTQKRRTNAEDWAEIQEREEAREIAPEMHSPLASAILDMANVMESSCSALSEALALLRLLAKGDHPGRDRLMDGIERITAQHRTLQGSTKALGISVALLKSGATEEPNRWPVYGEQSFAETARQSIRQSGASRSTAWHIQRQKTQRTQPRLNTRKLEIAREKQAIRCDARSLRLKPLAPTGAINGGTLARRLLEHLGTPGISEKDYVEDIRVDRAGNYYIQLFEGKFENTAQLLTKKLAEGNISLRELGRWSLSPPATSNSAGKVPVVVHDIPVKADMQKVIEEIWLSNKGRWGLNDEECSLDHLANPHRMNRRLKEGDILEWIPSKSIKVYVSKQIYARMTERDGLMFLVYDYNRVLIKDPREGNQYATKASKTTPRAPRQDRSPFLPPITIRPAVCREGVMSKPQTPHCYDQGIYDDPFCTETGLGRLNIYQLNCRRSREATDIFLTSLNKSHFNVILLSDPPSYLKKGGSYSNLRTILPTVDKDQMETCILISDSIDSVINPTFEGRITSITISFDFIRMTFYSTYIQPNTGIGWEALKEAVKRHRRKNPLDTFLIGGDFNARHPLWGDTENRLGKEVADWTDEEGLTILNKYPCYPTFINGSGHRSWIDLTLMSENGLFLDPHWEVIPNYNGLTDHSTIKTVLKTRRPPILTTETKNWRKADWSLVNQAVKTMIQEKGWKEVDWTEPKNEMELNELASGFALDLMQAAEPHVPKTRRCNFRKPWWSKELTEQHIKTKKAYRKAEKTKSPILKIILRAQANRERKELKSMITKAKKDAWFQFITENTREDLWPTFKRIIKPRANSRITHLARADGTRVTDTEEILDELAEKFFKPPPAELGEVPGSMQEREGEHQDTPQRDSSIPPVLEEEVREAILDGKPYGAPGPDGVPNILLRQLFPEIRGTLTGLYNAIVQAQIFPATWKEAKVIPIPKPNGSYRPISLLNTLGKGLESLVNKRFAHLMHSKLDQNQFGFRKQRSTQEALLSLTKRLELAIGEGKVVYAASLDITAAFDSVPTGKLIEAAIRAQLPNYMVRIMKSFVTGRSASLEVNNVLKRYPIYRGTPQGSPWSPGLFTMFLDPVLKLHENGKTSIQAFADDLIVTASSASEETCQKELQRTLDRIKEWTDGAGLSLNPDKCSAIRFLKQKRRGPMLQVKINGHTLAQSDRIKYLGIILDSSLSYRYHLEATARKCMQRLSQLKKLAKFYYGSDPAVLHTLVKRTIEPAIYYGCSSWVKASKHPRTIGMLHKAIRKCGLYISGCLPTTAYSSVHFLSGLRDPATEVESRNLSQARLLLSYNNSELIQDNIGNSHYIPPQASSFQANIHTEVRRLARLMRKHNILEVTKRKPYGIAPEASHLKIPETSTSPLQEEPCAPQISGCVAVERERNGLQWAWTLQQGGRNISDSGTTEESRCPISTELKLVRDLLQLMIPLAESMENPTIKLAISGKAKTHLRRNTNLLRFAHEAQAIIARLKGRNARLAWCPVTNPTPDLQDQAERTKNLLKTSNNKPHRLKDVGWEWSKFDSWRFWLANTKVQNYCEEYDSGKALTSTGIKFSTVPPCCFLVRAKGSPLSQFLANHFPSKHYLARFNLLPSNETRNCECGNDIEDRDHLLFCCPLLSEERETLKTTAGNALDWKDLLEAPEALADFVSAISNLWRKHGRRWA